MMSLSFQKVSDKQLDIQITIYFSINYYFKSQKLMWETIKPWN